MLAKLRKYTRDSGLRTRGSERRELSRIVNLSIEYSNPRRIFVFSRRQEGSEIVSENRFIGSAVFEVKKTYFEIVRASFEIASSIYPPYTTLRVHPPVIASMLCNIENQRQNQFEN